MSNCPLSDRVQQLSQQLRARLKENLAIAILLVGWRRRRLVGVCRSAAMGYAMNGSAVLAAGLALALIAVLQPSSASTLSPSARSVASPPTSMLARVVARPVLLEPTAARRRLHRRHAYIRIHNGSSRQSANLQLQRIDAPMIAQQSKLMETISTESSVTLPSFETLAPIAARAATMLAQPRACESPLHSHFFANELHPSLQCADPIGDQTATLDGFARMRYHIAVR